MPPESPVIDGTVNVINLYARSAGCKMSPYDSLWEEAISVPNNGKHTHVYVTILSDNISVR